MVTRALYRSRLYINLLRSGQRWIDVCPAQVRLRALQRGDKLNVYNIATKSLDLVCEVADKTHYKSMTELLANEGIHRCLSGVAANTLDASELDARAVKVLTPSGQAVEASEIEQFGVFAIHLRVVEDL